MTMNVISYFDAIPDLEFSKQSEDILSIWTDTWKRHGWNPIILEHEMAKKNKLYHQLDLDNPQANFYKTIHESMWKYHKTCYCRLLAYCEYVRNNGATLYADYDVINYGFTPDIIKNIEHDSYLCIHRSVMFLGLTGIDDIERVILKFNNEPFSEGDERGSCNDLNVMRKYTKVFKSKLMPSGDWYTTYIEPNFRNNSPLVHYDGGCYKRGISRSMTRVDIIKKHNRI